MQYEYIVPRMDAINFQSSVARMRQAAALRAFEAMPGVKPTQPANAPQTTRTAQDTEQVQSPQASAARARIVSKLVAATVPGKVDFSSDNATPSQNAAIPMYRHPADKNVAATGVWSGRAIDVEA